MRALFAAFLVLLPAHSVPASQSPRPPARRTGAFVDTRLTESSGVVVSREHPGWLWTMNDSGNDPLLFLTDTSGRAIATFVVRGAVNIDWEAMGRGRCGERDCLIIGDIGDNGESRKAVTLYRVPEPAEPAALGITRKAETLDVRFPGGARDAEALYVEPSGSVVIITKGRQGGVLVFRVPSAAWGSPRGITAVRIDSLAIPASMMRGRVVTDAAISADGRRVAVRTYREVRFFVRDREGRLAPEPGRPVCDIAGLEPQGEGIDWWDREALVLTSERGLSPAGTISLLQCPVR